MKNQYFVMFGLNGQPTNHLYQFNVDVELQQNADTTTMKITMELAKKFNSVYVKRITWEDISISILTKLN
jgi:hypothetical protein